MTTENDGDGIDRDQASRLARAGEWVRDAEALLIGAGAGMGVDSGLPDFRGPEGFWRAYPAIAKLGLRFEELANPRWFDRDPALAWGFYGHRLNLYRDTVPHEGFTTLLKWGERMPLGYFVFTSNVDGQFQKAGFDPERVVERHGSIHFGQCATPCCEEIWRLGERVQVDEETMRAKGVLPGCAWCGGMGRPNVLMFGDSRWVEHRVRAQLERYRNWVRSVRGKRVVVMEFGAGSAVPTVRMECERVAAMPNAKLVRVNPRESWVPEGHVGIAMGAVEAVRVMRL